MTWQIGDKVLPPGLFSQPFEFEDFPDNMWSLNIRTNEEIVSGKSYDVPLAPLAEGAIPHFKVGNCFNLSWMKGMSATGVITEVREASAEEVFEALGWRPSY